MHQAEVFRLWRISPTLRLTSKLVDLRAGMRSGFDELTLIEPLLTGLCIIMMHAVASLLCRGIEAVITGLTRNQFVDNTTRGFESLPLRQIRNSRLIQSYRPTVFFLSLKIDRKSLVYKGFFAFAVHFGICGAYILCLGYPKMQKSTTPRQGVVPFYR